MSTTMTHDHPYQPHRPRRPPRSGPDLLQPVPNFCIDNFPERRIVRRPRCSTPIPPSRRRAKAGRTFSAVNEKRKVQVTDSSSFAEPIAELNRTLASPEFLDLLSDVFGHAQPPARRRQLNGGGIHQTGARGHLDVHVDFNFIAERELHRRLNILIYFNKDWKPEWGGNIELWDKDVKVCVHSFSPIFNRCVVFETNEISYHGVTAVKCPEDGPQVVRGLLLHQGGPGPLDRRGPRDDLQGPPRRGPQGERHDAPREGREAAPGRPVRVQEEAHGKIAWCPPHRPLRRPGQRGPRHYDGRARIRASRQRSQVPESW